MTAAKQHVVLVRYRSDGSLGPEHIRSSHHATLADAARAAAREQEKWRDDLLPENHARSLPVFRAVTLIEEPDAQETFHVGYVNSANTFIVLASFGDEHTDADEAMRLAYARAVAEINARADWPNPDGYRMIVADPLREHADYAVAADGRIERVTIDPGSWDWRYCAA